MVLLFLWGCRGGSSLWAVVALSVSLSDSFSGPAVIVLAESFLSSLNLIVCGVVCNVGLCLCVFWLGAALPSGVESGIGVIAIRGCG